MYLHSHQPFFSVIIPLYNKEAYIAATIRSVLDQTFQSFEILIVDDGSTDKSKEIVQLFRDSRIKVSTKENGGASSARNYGIKESIGSYLAFLDADDTWACDYLHRMQMFIEAYPGCGLYIAAYYVVEEKNKYANGASIPEGIIQSFFKTEIDHHIIRISATIVPADILKYTFKFPNGMVSGEDAFLCALIAKHYKTVYVPSPLVNYNIRYSSKELRYDKVDSCRESWFDLLEKGNYHLNEFIAIKAIKAGIRHALGFCKEKSLCIERVTSFTNLARREWFIMFLLNRIPYSIIRLYKSIKPVLKKMKQYS